MLSFSRVHKKIFQFLWSLVVIFILLCGVAGALIYYLEYSPTAVESEFQPVYVEVPRGASARTVAGLLFQAKVVRSEHAFLVALKLAGKSEVVLSGTYYFTQALSPNETVDRVTRARYDLPMKKVVLYEGEANFAYAERLEELFDGVTREDFLEQARGHEGYLFPDTYFFPTTISTEEVIQALRSNFAKRTTKLEEDLIASHRSQEQIMIMASLVETEAGSASYATKQRVAGVLWKRLDIGMLLQADAVFSYIYQKHLPRVLYRHLEVDSPYNTYKHTGLPPGPIANPGLDSIRAAIEPHNPEGYLYYLTGNKGIFHYATTLRAHEQNRKAYLQY